ncbi:S8 family peptidase [uncultured Psychrobacter sp.]|uniref:S8 family peptidase n=1 Tax=uncultured Psychrobacter sp. TaxID=259303 RepID=UPI00345A7F28
MTNNTIKKMPASPCETVVIMQPDASLRASDGRLETASAEPVSDIKKLLDKYQASMRPMFGSTEERIERELLAESAEGVVDMPMPQLSRFYKLEVDDSRAQEAAAALAKLSQVEAAYVKPGAEPPIMLDEQVTSLQNDLGVPVTPDFISRQIYLDPSPVGVDAYFAHSQAGGRGQDVRIIDIEGAWRFSHEDLRQIQGGVVGGVQSEDVGWRNHGTAVLGVYSGDHNHFGISGISDQAMASAVSIFGGMGSAAAIRSAAARLRSGDVILLELHRPGPRYDFQARDDQQGYIAIEWWEDDYAAILAATRRGIIVIEAAGNGAENLDDDLYEVRPSDFPSSWRNSFRRSNRDSGAIFVGAGAPPPGTHGRDHGPDRSRLGFSNYGALVDAQGWGREVTTCGYGDLQSGLNEDVWYTDAFSGTSSASPIVVGAVASLQGMVRARGAALLSPAQMRQCVRATGAEQTDAPERPRTQRIGNRPDIKALYQYVFEDDEEGKDKEYIKLFKEFKEFEAFKRFREFEEFKKFKQFRQIKAFEKFKEEDSESFEDNGDKKLDENVDNPQLDNQPNSP